MEKEIMYEAFALLSRLGITANYEGFFHAAYSVALARQQPERLLLVTKWLYPEVAKKYGTTWQCVERNIRTIVALAWTRNPEYLQQLAGYPMIQKPRAGQFISILTDRLLQDQTA